jgi:hypothetical protein
MQLCDSDIMKSIKKDRGLMRPIEKGLTTKQFSTLQKLISQCSKKQTGRAIQDGLNVVVARMKNEQSKNKMLFCLATRQSIKKSGHTDKNKTLNFIGESQTEAF